MHGLFYSKIAYKTFELLSILNKVQHSIVAQQSAVRVGDQMISKTELCNRTMQRINMAYTGSFKTRNKKKNNIVNWNINILNLDQMPGLGPTHMIID